MPATPVYQLPYPAAADPADVPLDMQELADAIEAKIGPGTAAGQIPIWDNTAKKWVAGSRQLAYAEITANVTISATAEASATTIMTAPAVTLDGSTAIRVECFLPALTTAAAANAVVVLPLFDGGTSLGLIGQFRTPAAIGAQTPVLVSRQFTPSAASHTYSLRGFQSGGNGTLFAGAGGAGAFLPAYIRVSRV